MLPETLQKAEYSTQAMRVAHLLAEAAPSDRQQRILARYVYVEADSVRRSLTSRIKELGKRSDAGRRAKRAAKPFLREFAKHKEIRDRIASRRQAAADPRAADMQRTVELWQQITDASGKKLCLTAANACRGLGSTTDIEPRVPADRIAGITAALEEIQLRPDAVYTDVTSYGAGEANLLQTYSAGNLGRRITQINDIHDQLDLLYALRSLARPTDELGLLLRRALILEVATLVREALDHRPEIR